jgi:hypothetical protein
MKRINTAKLRCYPNRFGETTRIGKAANKLTPSNPILKLEKNDEKF